MTAYLLTKAKILLDGEEVGALNETDRPAEDEVDEVVAAVVKRSKEPWTLSYWGRTETGEWRHYDIEIEGRSCAYFVQGAPIRIEEMQEDDLQVFASLHSMHPRAASLLSQ